MFFLNKYNIFAGFVIFFIFTQPTTFGLIQNGLEQVAVPGSKEFAIERIKLTDNLREKAATAAVSKIYEAGMMSINAGADPRAVAFCEDGFIRAFKVLTTVRQMLNAAILKAHIFEDDKPETARDIIIKGLREIREYIFIDTVTVQTVHGTALAIAGEMARPGLEHAMELLQYCGVLLFESLRNAEKVALTGIVSGGVAARQALIAAHEIFNTGEEAMYKVLDESAFSSFEGLRAAAGKPPVRGFSERPDLSVPLETPEAQIAIDDLKAGFQAAKTVVSRSTDIEGIDIIYHSFLSSIWDNVRAIVKAYRAMDTAEKHLAADPEVAVAELHKALADVDDAILAVSADAILGLGAAGYIGGAEVQKGLEPAVQTVVVGRVNIFDDLKICEKLALNGLRARGAAARQGLKAARSIISAASNALFTHFIDAAHVAFNVLKTDRPLFGLF